MNIKKIGSLELNKTHLGDCMKLAKELPDNSVDLVVTSPPYADTVSYGNPLMYSALRIMLTGFCRCFMKQKDF